ncbi:fimbrial protein [Ralstonia flaminis]|jgi:type 1 fimbria pilin|uniref:Fimbrial-type adhesion domain-containing protein n=1 Tax=Ralstonia flaminis TaxID=3058597 RepID=A0ABN9JWF8_9RALS|nr:fimbrial protein [Ralstonia sp. LMG 18101]CAJ0822637.1 hypothetical protein LMG18101_05107 [Ralstonia sp. LMG 18101]
MAMLINRMKYGLMAIAAFHFSQSAYAQVNCTGGNYVATAEMGNIIDKGVGSLGRTTVVATGTPWTARCSGSGGSDRLVLYVPTGARGGSDGSITLTAGANSRYGLVLRSGNTVLGNDSALTIATMSSSGTVSYTLGSSTLSAELVKLNSNGTDWRGGLVLVGQARFVSNGTVGYNVYARVSSIAAPTCTVNNTSITIPLGNVSGGSFSNVGSRSTASGTQNIALTCTGSPRVRMTLQGTQAAGGPNTAVALTGAGGAGVAQGIGVEVLYGGNPLVVNSATPTVVSAAAGATLNVPIAARYYRTGTVTAGRANASPTLRFDYD